MALPWRVIERAETADGRLELRRRGRSDVLLLIDGRVLMSSREHRSEVALAQIACRQLVAGPQPTVLLGGLGLGYTLQAALDILPAGARVVVSEINPIVARWCRERLTDLAGAAVDDPRVELCIEDVAVTIRDAERQGGSCFDAVLFDLYAGPGADTDPVQDAFYGSRALTRIRNVLRPGGVFAVWSEQPCPRFERRLRAAGFRSRPERPWRGGLRHVVYVGRRP